MGFLSRAFGGGGIEGELLEAYSMQFQQAGMPTNLARQMAKEMVQEAKKRTQEAVEWNLPPNSGDRLLEVEKTNPEVRATLQKKREEGVKDEDIRWWHNMHPLERHMMILFDQTSQMVVFKQLKEQNLSSGEIRHKLILTFPTYGDPQDESRVQGEHRPLPIELKDRINKFLELEGSDFLERSRAEVERAGSFNAWIRSQIQRGKV